VRQVYLCREANAEVARFVGARKQGFLFEGRDGKPLSSTSVYRFALAKTNIPGAHSLRRFRATILGVTEGFPMALVQYLLGHGAGSMSKKKSMRPAEMASHKVWAEKAGLGFALPT